MLSILHLGSEIALITLEFQKEEGAADMGCALWGVDW